VFVQLAIDPETNADASSPAVRARRATTRVALEKALAAYADVPAQAEAPETTFSCCHPLVHILRVQGDVADVRLQVSDVALHLGERFFVGRRSSLGGLCLLRGGIGCL